VKYVFRLVSSDFLCLHQGSLSQKVFKFEKFGKQKLSKCVLSYSATLTGLVVRLLNAEL
jgi:hypothetical protein